MKNTWILLSIAALALLAIVLWFELPALSPGNQSGNSTTTPSTDGMSFESEGYNFSLTYPSGWALSTTSLNDGITPATNVYVIEPGETPPPYTHHSEATNVSLFPEGIPTEGLFAQFEPLNFDPGFPYDATSSRQFILEDGTPFAAYIIPEQTPQNWQPWGFVWMRVQVDNLSTQCVDENNTLIPEMQCDPLAQNHEIVWSGFRSDARWQQALNIVRSIEFEG